MSTTAMKPQKIETQKEAISKTRLDKAKLLLSKLFTDQQMGQLKQVSNAFNKLTNKQKQFISAADQIETTQRQVWVKGIFDYLNEHHFCEKTSGLFLSEEILEYVKDSVRQHRFIAGGCGGHRFNTAIIGPPKSGKSTLLELYAQEIVADMANCGDWKNSFVIAFDFRELAPKVSDIKEFYITMVRMVCDTIIKEKPVLTKFIPDIRRYLENLVTDPSPLVLAKSHIENVPLKKMQQNIINIGEDILSTWRNPIAFEGWITTIFELPVIIPNALGFTKTIFIIDNFDFCDIKLEPMAPFTNSHRMAFVSEHVKYALSKSDYIFACHNMQKMYEALVSIDQEGVDLFAFTDFLPTNGISPDIVENDLPLVVSLSTQDLPFVMKGSDCDGVPNYIMLWKDLNQSIEEMEVFSEGSDEFDDARYYAIAHAQAIMNLMFFSEEADYTDEEEASWPHVLSIRRASENENVQYRQEEAVNQQFIQNEIDAIPIDNAPQNLAEEEANGDKVN
ncbi:hypothetical protein TRFO_09892 [Tritrichomonas foetus]|uniref:Uncharacterized protein n=1 Tax=Tritrichomonas foetus TaxID=1144522 RepID=A0A1J4JBE8_9EUKA|nr:hypothetical protein TRFO_09892 [Tritrichomonas foetus]|eukprot:OHS96510.1 hypothetical protein TRFO_09892 [Tritrichomonas foetus]